MNYTQLIIGILGVIVTICISLITKYAVPWLKEKNLFEAAVIAVNAAEAIYGRYHGEEKLVAALEALKEKGYNIDSNAVKNAVQAAWKQLDGAMYANGEKYLPE